jgi:hypothetical protein
MLQIAMYRALFANVSGAHESIPPGWESIPGLLKSVTNSGFVRSTHRLNMELDLYFYNLYMKLYEQIKKRVAVGHLYLQKLNHPAHQ